MNEANINRQIILDTETTGMNQAGGAHYLGHRIIEIGGVEMVNRKLTGRTFHVYLNPEQEIDAEAIAVHGITNERVAHEPLFADIYQDFLSFVEGAELIAHNAPFDVGFLDHELSQVGYDKSIEDLCQVTDSLKLAKKAFPGQKNNLDALCKRYGIDNSHRTLHGALLDAEILSDVYLMMTGGQTELKWLSKGENIQESDIRFVTSKHSFKVIQATADELEEHEKYLERLTQKGTCVWRNI
tara:strand:- start:1626 stop:2348 length:723 start_codon:yes stop_codon:yes gene_type:complete